MSTIQIHLPDELKQRVTVKAAESGYAKVEEFVEALLIAECGNETADEDLEALLLQRLDSGPGIEVTPEFRKQFMERLAQRRPPMGA